LLRNIRQGRKLISGAWQVGDAVIAIDRDLGDWLENNSSARRDQAVYAAQLIPVPIVEIMQIEPIKPINCYRLKV
jgi:hypothetical protein